MKEHLENLIRKLEEQHQEIMGAENSALAALEQKDNAAYSQYMHEKAELLANLRDEAKPFFKKLDAQLQEEVDKTLANFSHNADMALNLDSTFYMSALLYPDDHKKGEPDNLARLIARIRAYKEKS